MTERYASGFGSAPEPSRLAATVLAADDGSGSGSLPKALRIAGVGVGDLRHLEDAGLVELGAVPHFVHPLARSAVYSAASPSLRRHAHRAWAEASAEAGSPLRALRHRAAAAEGPDESLAQSLEDEAGRLAASGLSEASTTAELAADLSESYAGRTRRLLLAIETSRDGGRTQSLADLVLASSPSSEQFARLVVAVDLDLLGLTAERLERQLSQLDLEPIPTELRVRLDVTRIWAAVHSTDLGRLQSLTAALDADRDRGWLVTATLASRTPSSARTGSASSPPRGGPGHAPAERRRPASALGLGLGDHPGLARGGRCRAPTALRRDGPTIRAASERPQLTAVAAFFSAEIARRDGRWRTAEALLTEAADIGAACSEPSGPERTRLAMLAARRGDIAAAEAMLSRADAAFSDSVTSWNNYFLGYTRGLIAAESGQPDAAIEAFRPVAHAPFVGAAAGTPWHCRRSSWWSSSPSRADTRRPPRSCPCSRSGSTGSWTRSDSHCCTAAERWWPTTRRCFPSSRLHSSCMPGPTTSSSARGPSSSSVSTCGATRGPRTRGPSRRGVAHLRRSRGTRLGRAREGRLARAAALRRSPRSGTPPR